jgi:tellurite resistance protein TerC
MNIVWLWAAFVLVIGLMTGLDLGVLQKRAHVMKVREAAMMSGLWVVIAFCFSIAVAFAFTREKAMLFLTGYLLELSLSVDNLFVFIIVFHYFSIQPEHQPRILHWGILSAIVMRFVFIFAGVSLVQASQAMFYVFGAILLWTGGKLLFGGEEKPPEPDKNPALRLLHKFLPVTQSPHGQNFFVHLNERWHATPLFAALVVIEFTDIVFALDSIPAALGVTSDLFVVYTSNIFAVMGLRSMYFLISGSMMEFRYLKTGISLVLVFIGVKLMLHKLVHMPVSLSLGVVGVVLIGSIVASLAVRKS